MVNVNGRETGLSEPRRAYGRAINVSSVALYGRLRRSNQAMFLSDENLKGGRLAHRGW
jgi:hypothetical protein